MLEIGFDILKVNSLYHSFMFVVFMPPSSSESQCWAERSSHNQCVLGLHWFCDYLLSCRCTVALLGRIDDGDWSTERSHVCLWNLDLQGLEPKQADLFIDEISRLSRPTAVTLTSPASMQVLWCHEPITCEPTPYVSVFLKMPPFAPVRSGVPQEPVLLILMIMDVTETSVS